MQYEVSLKVGSEQPGCDPEALSSLGKLAAMFAGKIGSDAPKTRLGETANEYDGKIKKKALDLFDLHKIDLSNEYEDPETIGERTP